MAAMDYLDCEKVRWELTMQRVKLQGLRDDLVADDGHNAFVTYQNAIAAVENAIWDLDDAISAIYELGQSKGRGREVDD